MTPTRIRIRRASAVDAAKLSRLAEATFRDTFESENAAEDMERYVKQAFGTAQQAADISDPEGVVLVAERPLPSGEGELVGYAHVVLGVAPEPVQGSSPAELKRLYVAREWHGRGVAQALMDAALAAARERGALTLWLGVWERNPRAVAFYLKYGFQRVGEQTFTLGADQQTDWILARTLDLASTA